MTGSLPNATGRIFISYRREETAYPAGWLYEDRDDPDVPGQGGLDFQAYKVVGVVKPAPAMLVSDGQPLIADQHEHHVAGAHRPGD
jgi:hypothetical protein